MAVDKFLKRVVYVAAAGSAGFSGQVFAQALSRPIPVLPSDYPSERSSVAERYRPEYQSAGVPVGSYTLLPEVGVGLGYIDNVFGAESNKASDFYAAINPSVTLTRQGGAATGATITATAAANLRRFFDEKAANETGYRGMLDGAVPLGNAVTINGGGGYERAYQRQDSGAFLTTARSPIRVDNLTGYLRARLGGSRIRTTVGVDVRDEAYGDARLTDGSRIDQGYRDLTTLRGVARVETSFTGALSGFVEGRYSDLNYNRQFIAPGLANRDGKQAEGYVGLRVDAGKLRGIVSGGYTHRTFDANVYRNFGGLAIDGELTYFASGLTTYTLTAFRNISETGDAGVTALFGTGGRLRVDHELLRYIILSGRVGYDSYSYRGINRSDKIATVGGGVRYLANRRFEINADADYTKRTSNNAFGTEFNRFQVLVSLVARL
jgi:hypothetical protein